MAQAVSTLPFRQRMRSSLRVMRGQQIAVSVATFDEAIKRAATVIYPEALYGAWGEAPPVEVEATPVLFRTSEAVKAAVEEFANKVATTPLHLYKHINAAGEREEVKTHPGLTVLRNPNPFLTRWLLFWNVAADLKLSGNAFWFLAGPTNGQPQEIWRCNPRHTRVVRSARQYIAGYVTEIDGHLIPLDVKEVIHFKRPNVISEDDLYGLGDLAPAATAAQTGVDMARWNRQMFSRDQAVPAGVVSVENNVSDADFDRLKKEWRESYGAGARRTAFIRGSKVQFQGIGLSQTDVDFLNGSKWEAEKVYRVFGTYHLLPAQFADDRKVNERQFLEGHAWPLLTYLSEVLSDQFFGFWGPKDGVGLLTGEFEDIRPRERALDLEEEQEEAKGLTFNEWREKRGLEALEGGDKVLFVHVQGGIPLESVSGESSGGDGTTDTTANTTGDAAPANLESTLGLNGIQIQAALSVLEQVAAGSIKPAAGIELLVALGIERERALIMVPLKPDNPGADLSAADHSPTAQSPDILGPVQESPKSDAAQPQDAQDRAEQRESSGDDVGDDVGDFADKAVAPAIHRELRQWEKFTGKRQGTEHAREFIPACIPAYVAALVRSALDESTAPEAIKAVFETAHGLVDGKLPLKSSYGPPDGTVVLYLSGVEDVLLIQQMLQRSVPSDAPFRWTPREQLHITLVHCPIVDEPDYRQISQETGPFAVLNITATEITTFEAQNGATPIVALVEPTEDLRALQADVWADCAARGIAVSEYSQPDLWKPHITLGYAEDIAFSGLMLGALPFACTADTLSFTRGSFENLYSRSASVPSVDMPKVDADALATIKAIQATRLDFEAEFEDVLAAARGGQIDRRAWANRTRTLLRRYGEKAYRDGLKDGGVVYEDTEPLDPDDRADLNGLLGTQSQYVTELGRVVFRTERGVSDGQAAIKPAMWFNKSVLPLYQAGLVVADKNGLYSWSYNPLKQNCPSCLEAAKQIHRLKVWHTFDLVPNSSRLICKGFFCGCQLHKTEGRSIGRIDRIPTAAGKADHEHEEPAVAVQYEEPAMTVQWPESLPAPIKAEFERVLRKQVQSCVAADEGSYELTLREAAGYYAGVSEDELQRGLGMIDPRLKLIGFEMVGDTDLKVKFSVEAIREVTP